MIRQIIRIFISPLQSFFYAVRRRKNAKKMMNHHLGIKANNFTVDYKMQGAIQHGK